MDLGSLNGTLVNGREISRAVQLADGDIVIFDEQEYRFTGSATDAQSGSDNVTVIANKDEIGRPDRIKPAIRLVEPAPAQAPPPAPAPVNTDASVDAAASTNASYDAALDETAAWDSLANRLDETQSADNQDTGQRDSRISKSQAADQKQQRDRLTEKLRAQKTPMQESSAQDSPAMDSPAQNRQVPNVQTPMLPIQESQAQVPLDKNGTAPQVHESRAQGSADQEAQMAGNRSNSNAQYAHDPDAFEWHSDEPREVKLPPQQQPANRHHQHQAAPQNETIPQGQGSQHANIRHDQDDQDEYMAFPVSSRPGGNARPAGNARSRGNAHFRADERSTRPGLQKHSYRPEPARKVNWARWLIIIPLIIVLALGAIYLAYNAGYTAGTGGSGSSNGFS